MFEIDQIKSPFFMECFVHIMLSDYRNRQGHLIRWVIGTDKRKTYVLINGQHFRRYNQSNRSIFWRCSQAKVTGCVG